MVDIGRLIMIIPVLLYHLILCSRGITGATGEIDITTSTATMTTATMMRLVITKIEQLNGVSQANIER